MKYQRPLEINKREVLKPFIESVLDQSWTIVSKMGGDLDSIIVDYDRFEELVQEVCSSLEEEYAFRDA